MVVTPLPMDTEVSPVQPEKAQSPMVVTLFGMVTTDNFVQLAKTPCWMSFRPFEMVIDVSPVQPSNADSPMEVILLGIVTTVKSEQPEKAFVPIVFKLLGKDTEMMPLQSEKA